MIVTNVAIKQNSLIVERLKKDPLINFDMHYLWKSLLQVHLHTYYCIGIQVSFWLHSIHEFAQFVLNVSKIVLFPKN